MQTVYDLIDADHCGKETADWHCQLGDFEKKKINYSHSLE